MWIKILTYGTTRTLAGEGCKAAAAFQGWLAHAVHAETGIQFGCCGSKHEGRYAGRDEQGRDDVEEAHWARSAGVGGDSRID